MAPLVRLAMDMEIYFNETDQEQRLRLHGERVVRAKTWLETGEKINKVKIKEGSLEEHFEANWDKFNGYYHGLINKWLSAYLKKDELTIVEPADGRKTMVVDTDNLVIGRLEDIFYFPKLEPCWGIVIDV